MIAFLFLMFAQTVQASVPSAFTPSTDDFWESIRDNDVPAVVAMVKLGVSPDASTKADTPLCYSIRRGNSEMVDALLKLGASANLSEPISQYTPLMVAAKHQRPEAVEPLLSHGANVNQTSVFGRNALHMAALYDSIDVARILLQKTPVDGNARGKLCPLAVASRQGYVEFVKLLLAEYQGKFSERCLTSAKEMAEYNHHDEVLAILNSKK